MFVVPQQGSRQFVAIVTGQGERRQQEINLSHVVVVPVHCIPVVTRFQNQIPLDLEEPPHALPIPAISVYKKNGPAFCGHTHFVRSERLQVRSRYAASASQDEQRNATLRKLSLT